jgi:hypothetical protein
MDPTPSELHERDELPHFDVTTLDGRRVRYTQLWQRRNLLLVLTDPQRRPEAIALSLELNAHSKKFDDAETTVVVTADTFPGLRAPCVLIADRWGEIMHIAAPSSDRQSFPTVDELLTWVHFAQIQCPECPP